MVPSTPTSGMDAMNSGMVGPRNAASSIRPRSRALTRSMRDRPEPFSITSSGIGKSSAGRELLHSRG